MNVHLELGRWYWIRGNGPRKLIEIHPQGLRMKSAGGYLAWFAHESVLYEATLEMWQTYREQSEARGVAPQEWPPESYPPMED